MSISLRERKKLLEKVVNEVEGKFEIVKYKVMSKCEDIEK
jgi:ATP-dependent DNA ligase